MTDSRPLRVVIVLGTRPEAIKLAPIIRALEAHPRFDPRTVATAQHRDLLDGVLDVFEVSPDYDLDLMRENQGLGELTARAVMQLTSVLESEHPDIVVVQGDTTTAMAGALSAFYGGYPVAHVEAGLRSGDKQNPFPEEINRQIVTRIADLHFAPTEANRSTLIGEGVPADSVFVTGNPGIDALLHTVSAMDEGWLQSDLPPAPGGRRMILVTLHRRESFGEPLARICGALRSIASAYADVDILYPVHPNPNVRETVASELSDVPGVRLVPPLTYTEFVAAMRESYIIVTDSGGIQEEAPSLGKPVLVLREVTERVEAVAIGAAKLVGRDPKAVEAAIRQLLEDDRAYTRMTGHPNPYGDGRAAERMVETMLAFLTSRGNTRGDLEPRVMTGGSGSPASAEGVA